MALQKTKTIKGFEANYWRFLEIHTNMNRNDAVCVFGLYKDQATREADPDAILETVQFDLDGELLNAQGGTDTVRNINISKAYASLKTRALAEAEKEEVDQSLAFFSDAVDA